MGMYDTVLVPCPKCGIKEEFQSKSSECSLQIFELYECPVDILEDVNRHSPYTCDCGTLFAVCQESRTSTFHGTLKPKPKPKPKSIQEHIKDIQETKYNPKIQSKPNKKEIKKFKNWLNENHQGMYVKISDYMVEKYFKEIKPK